METRMRTTIRAACAAGAACLILASSVAGFAGEEGDSKINPAWEFNRANRLASAGAVTRSIPHYEKVLKAAPAQYPQAHFNLAEVYRFKDNCRKAVLLYNAYMAFEKGEQNRADAKKGIAKCTAGKKTGTLSVELAEKSDSKVLVDGYILGQNGGFEEATLLPGEYAVQARAKDHLPTTEKVAVAADEAAEKSFDLEKKLFYGTVKVDVSQKGATIKLEPKKLDSPKAQDEVISLTSPMEKPKKLATGKYFLEVTKDGYDRWIRNIYIKRDDQTSVQVEMSKALPAAIRGD